MASICLEAFEKTARPVEIGIRGVLRQCIDVAMEGEHVDLKTRIAARSDRQSKTRGFCCGYYNWGRAFLLQR